MRRDMQLTGYTAGVRADIEVMAEGSKSLLQQSGGLLKEAFDQKHPLLFAEAW